MGSGSGSEVPEASRGCLGPLLVGDREAFDVGLHSEPVRLCECPELLGGALLRCELRPVHAGDAAVHTAARSERHARAGRGSSADHKSSPAKRSARRDQDHASSRRLARPRCFAAAPPRNAASGVLAPSRRRQDGRVLFSPVRRKSKDVASLVMQPCKVGEVSGGLMTRYEMTR